MPPFSPSVKIVWCHFRQMSCPNSEICRSKHTKGSLRLIFNQNAGSQLCFVFLQICCCSCWEICSMLFTLTLRPWLWPAWATPSTSVMGPDLNWQFYIVIASNTSSVSCTSRPLLLCSRLQMTMWAVLSPTLVQSWVQLSSVPGWLSVSTTHSARKFLRVNSSGNYQSGEDIYTSCNKGHINAVPKNRNNKIQW